MAGIGDLTPLQLELMEILWSLEEATVDEVHKRLPPHRELARPTVATLLSRLEKRGAVGHRTDSRQYVYNATVSRDEVRNSMVGALVERLFGGSTAELTAHLLGAAKVDPIELARIEALIREHEQEETR